MEYMPDRLVFGTDGPTLYEEVELAKIAVAERDFGLTRPEKQKILGENGVRLWRVDLSARGTKSDATPAATARVGG